jgi:hypothetical protein
MRNGIDISAPINIDKQIEDGMLVPVQELKIPPVVETVDVEMLNADERAVTSVVKQLVYYCPKWTYLKDFNGVKKCFPVCPPRMFYTQGICIIGCPPGWHMGFDDFCI